ncbi:MAG TPA: AraC family transcriptional regulator [Steroidobacteraceae bacterium]|jgi:AraC-like DNA-binding protein|nr:AraC family transcriptional regulator [Steroidobacteraceae bacterium]
MSTDLTAPIDFDALQRELAARVSAFATIDGVHDTRITGLTTMRASAPSQPLPSVYEPCLCIVVQGRKQARLKDEVYVYDALNYLVVSVTLPVVGQIIEASDERPYLCLRINVDRKLIGELLLQSGPTLVKQRDSDRGLYVAKTEGGLLDAVVRLVRLLDQPRDANVLAPLVMREIHYRALTGELGARLRDLCIVDSQMQRISRAIDVLRSRFSEGFRIEDLASIAHMSPSSFHHRFKEVTAMSPVQFQKQLRLHEARRLMLTEGLEAAAAAHKVGYESPSQFSREYRRLFGAPPRREIDALRA